MLTNAVRKCATIARNGSHGSSRSKGKFKPRQTVEESSCATQYMDFSNPQESFQSNTTRQLLRAIFVLNLTAKEVIANNALNILNKSRKVFGKHIFESVMRATVYGHFVIGDTASEIKNATDKLVSVGVCPMLVASLEEDIGEEIDEHKYDRNLSAILNGLQMTERFKVAERKMQLKLTGLMPPDTVVALGELCQRLGHPPSLVELLAATMTKSSAVELAGMDHKHIKYLSDGLHRLSQVCKCAEDCGVKVLVDGEQTYMTDGITCLTNALMLFANTNTPRVWNTYQCYLKRAPQMIETDSRLILDTFGICFGAKFVRGAYMIQERQVAARNGIESPIHDNYEQTSACYNNVISNILEMVAERKHRCEIMVASHNVPSVKAAVKRMDELNIFKEFSGVCFGQVMGRSDHITYILGKSGYNVYKSLPYGNVQDTLVYLARRASENHSVLAEEYVKDERKMMVVEVKNRLLRWKK